MGLPGWKNPKMVSLLVGGAPEQHEAKKTSLTSRETSCPSADFEAHSLACPIIRGGFYSLPLGLTFPVLRAGGRS